MSRRFQQVDVFAATPLLGNPLAVVFDAEGLTTERMHAIARWTNLSETTFLLPPTSPDADYRVRIFTLVGELPFAGHPTLGSCHAWLHAGGRPRGDDVIVQECGAGLVPIRRTDDGLAFAAPPLVRSGPVDEVSVTELAALLAIDREEVVDTAWVDNGPGWVGVLLRDADAVLAIDPDVSAHDRSRQWDIGLIGPHPPGAECEFEVRALFTDGTGSLREDPVTGSLNASLGQWLLATDRAKAPYLVSQGTRIGRAGRPLIEQDDGGTVWVGGPCFTCVEGTIDV